jgi:hypothetical protein
MQLQRVFSRVVIASSLLGTPVAAFADPAPIAARSTSVTTPGKTAVALEEDAARYAQLERQSPAAGKFEGGGESIYIGGSVLTVVLVLLLVIIIL